MFKHFGTNIYIFFGYPDGSVVRNLLASAGDAVLIPGLVRASGERNGNPLQYSCLGNLVDGGACWATVRRVAKKLDIT